MTNQEKHTNNIDASKNSSYETVKQFSYWPLQMERFSKHTFNHYHIYLHLPTWLLLQVWCNGKTEQVLKQNWHLQDVTSALSFLNADVCCIPIPPSSFLGSPKIQKPACKMISFLQSTPQFHMVESWKLLLRDPSLCTHVTFCLEFNCACEKFTKPHCCTSSSWS